TGAGAGARALAAVRRAHRRGAGPAGRGVVRATPAGRGHPGGQYQHGHAGADRADHRRGADRRGAFGPRRGAGAGRVRDRGGAVARPVPRGSGVRAQRPVRLRPRRHPRGLPDGWRGRRHSRPGSEGRDDLVPAPLLPPPLRRHLAADPVRRRRPPGAAQRPHRPAGGRCTAAPALEAGRLLRRAVREGVKRESRARQVGPHAHPAFPIHLPLPPLAGGRLGWGAAPQGRKAPAPPACPPPHHPTSAASGGTRGWPPRGGERTQPPPFPPPRPPPPPRGRGSGPREPGRRQPTRPPARRPRPPLPPPPSPRWGGKVGRGGRAAGAEGARATRLPPPQPSPVHGGGGHQRAFGNRRRRSQATTSAGTRTQPSISTRALRLITAFVTLQRPSTCSTEAPTCRVPEGCPKRTTSRRPPPAARFTRVPGTAAAVAIATDAVPIIAWCSLPIDSARTLRSMSAAAIALPLEAT